MEAKKTAEDELKCANIYKSFGHNKEAKEKYLKALELCKDQTQRASIERELGKLYYHQTSGVLNGLEYFRSALKNPFAGTTEANDALDNILDIKSFMYSFLRLSRGKISESNGKRDVKEVYARLNIATLVSSRSDIPSFLYPLDIQFGYKYTDFLGSKDVKAALITSEDVAKNPMMPYPLQQKAGVPYGLLDIKSMQNLNLDLSYSLYTFDTMPFFVYELFPKITLGYGVALTVVDANVHKYGDYMPAKQDLHEEIQQKKLSAVKHTFSTDLDMGSIILGEGNYTKTWYFTPLFGGKWSSLCARNAENIYSLMDNKDLPEAGKMFSDSYSIGLRINTPRVPNNPDFKTSRFNIAIYYLFDRGAISATENGVWPGENLGWKNSAKMMLDYEFDWLVRGKDAADNLLDKTPIILAFPVVSAQYWRKDDYTYYWGVSGGARYMEIEFMYTYFESRDGGSYNSKNQSMGFQVRH